MEIILALGIGVLAGSGVWLILRPRTFQVIIGLSLLSYAVNLFIIAMGRLRTGARSGPDGARGGRSLAICRSAAASARPDRHRHQLCDDGAVPGRAARVARPDGHRPCRRTGAGTVSRIADHLMIAPVVLPLFAGAVMLAPRRRAAPQRQGRASMSRRPSRSSASRSRCSRLSDAAPTRRRRGVYRLGDWPAPFGIVLVVDRLSALMLLLTSILAVGRRGLLARALAPRGRAFPSPVPVPADGHQRSVSDRRSVQPVRLLRGAARRLVRPGAARLGRRARQGRVALHRHQPGGLAAVSDRRQPDLRRLRNAQHGGSRRAHPGTSRAEDRALLEAGAGILGIAFLLKAGMWPLCFWLPTTYAAASPPVASIFAIMTKVGVYIVLRLWLLLFGEAAGSIGAVRRRMAAVRRDGHGRIRRHRDAGVAGHGAARRIFRARVLRNGARRDRDGAGRRHRGSAVLPGQFDARHRRVLPPDRTRRARPRAGRGRARRHPGGVWGRR